MAFFSIPSNLISIAISLTLLSTLFFFLLLPPPQLYPSSSSLLPHRSLLDSSNDVPSPPCLPTNYTESNGVFNYFSLHFCLFQANPFHSVPFLALSVLLQFYILIKAAQDHFSVVVTKLVANLKLSPSMGAVTLLALGNGAPDVFASVAAVSGGQARTGFGAILSAGTFVSAFVVGFVAIYAAPFAVDPAPFLRDVLFYLVAAMFLFSVYLSAEIFLWQAVGFVAFYLFFVGVVFWMDLGMGVGRQGRVGGAGVKESEVGSVGDGEFPKVVGEVDCEKAEFSEKLQEEQKKNFGVLRALSKVTLLD